MIDTQRPILCHNFTVRRVRCCSVMVKIFLQIKYVLIVQVDG